MSRRRQIVVLGSMSKMPVAGLVWMTTAYLVGLERLGFEPYYVEAHARTPTTLMERGEDDSSVLAAGFIDTQLRRLGMSDRWAFHALHDDGRVYGMSEERLAALYRDAAAILNIHGGTLPRPEHLQSGRLVYVETDPVELEVQLYHGDADARALLDAHSAFFTWGLNYGNADCEVPLPAGLDYHLSFPPVVLDQWEIAPFGPRNLFTTVGNWRQEWRDLSFRGEVYHWSKHHEFLKFVDLPSKTAQPFELALASDDAETRAMLEGHGWRVRDAFRMSADLDAYRRYVIESRGEFTVAKDQNIRLRSGWFSDRSAMYLAAGCPVVTQDTGFGAVLPTGEGLFAFATEDEILAAVETINADHAGASRAAREIAREFLDAERVLGAMVDTLDLRTSGDLNLRPVSRWPTTLHAATVASVLDRPDPQTAPFGEPAPGRPATSVVVVTCDQLVFTRLCLDSVLEAGGPGLELIVVDNGSTDGTTAYLSRLAASDPRVTVILAGRNLGFAAAVNRGLRAARGDVLVLLNNDTIVAPGWLPGLRRHLANNAHGLVGAVSNRAATEAQIETGYDTYGELMAFAAARLREHAGATRAIASLTLFCAALRREVYEQVGELDEQFGLGMFEDDDYVARVRRAGYEVVCAEDVFVHHFGQASIGWLARTGAYGALFDENRRRYDAKWATRWEPHAARSTPERDAFVAELRRTVADLVPRGSNLLVVSRGDDELLVHAERAAAHFPQVDGGGYAGFHPADGATAIAQLTALRDAGADHLLIPKPSLWWLDHYRDLTEHLERSATVLHADAVCALYALTPPYPTPVARTDKEAA